MLFLIIYLAGWVAAGFAIKDLWTRKELPVLSRLGQTLLIFLFSWVGYFVYNYIVRGYLDMLRKSEQKAQEEREEQEFYDELNVFIK
ncbi:MAG: hypothetical protein ACI3Y4_08970 [Candidatus Cryptobacteroides sp.]